MTDAKVTLAHKKNLRDAEAKKPALLAKLKAASGVDFEFTFEPKFEDFVIWSSVDSATTNLLVALSTTTTATLLPSWNCKCRGEALKSRNLAL